MGNLTKVSGAFVFIGILILSSTGLTATRVASDFDLAIEQAQSLPQGTKSGSHPFNFVHEHPTKNVALLLHGLKDSPFSVRAIGEILYNQGWNVVGLLLTGHGTVPEDLFNVTEDNWINDLHNGMEIAASLGDFVTVGGFSTGGALAVYAALNPWLYPKAPASLMLFSPGIDFKNHLAHYACELKYFKKWEQDVPETGNPFTYTKMSANGICQLNKLMNDIGHASRARDIHLPTFMVMSDADTVIDPVVMKAFAEGLEGPHDLIEYPAVDGIGHNDLLFPQKIAPFIVNDNPHFEEMKERLVNFTESLEK